MYNPLFFQLIFTTFSFGEWIEISKVGRTGINNKGDEFSVSTLPSYENTLVKPELYDITVLPEAEEIHAKLRDELANISLHFTEKPIVDDTIETNIEYSSKENNSESLFLDSSNQFSDDLSAKTVRSDEMKGTNYENLLTDISLDMKHQGSGEVDDEETDDKEERTLGFVDSIKHVQEKLLDFKGQSMHAKIERLESLRDRMLLEIKHRMSLLFKPWLGDSRMYKDNYFDDHQMDYPSNEGALMTIGFLTFAVFLIKLVLKLIYTLKIKQQYYYTTTTTPASIFLKQDREDSAQILKYIDEFSPS